MSAPRSGSKQEKFIDELKKSSMSLEGFNERLHRKAEERGICEKLYKSLIKDYLTLDPAQSEEERRLLLAKVDAVKMRFSLLTHYESLIEGHLYLHYKMKDEILAWDRDIWIDFITN